MISPIFGRGEERGKGRTGPIPDTDADDIITIDSCHHPRDSESEFSSCPFFFSLAKNKSK